MLQQKPGFACNEELMGSFACNEQLMVSFACNEQLMGPFACNEELMSSVGCRCVTNQFFVLHAYYPLADFGAREAWSTSL